MKRTAFCAIALLTATGILIGSGDLDLGGGRVLGLLLVSLAPVAIAAGIFRQARRAQMITIRTMFGVLCIYLLIGTAFAYAYGLNSAVDDGTFFAEISGGDQSDFLYFSFTTMTTTGFGDFTARSRGGHALTVLEMLTGQLYLVTVIALLVSNLRRRPLEVSSPARGDARSPRRGDALASGRVELRDPHPGAGQ